MTNHSFLQDEDTSPSTRSPLPTPTNPSTEEEEDGKSAVILSAHRQQQQLQEGEGQETTIPRSLHSFFSRTESLRSHTASWLHSIVYKVDHFWQKVVRETSELISTLSTYSFHSFYFILKIKLANMVFFFQNVITASWQCPWLIIERKEFYR